MHSAHDLRGAPRLVDAQVGHYVRILLATLLRTRSPGRARKRGGWRVHAGIALTFESQRGRQTVAELSGVGAHSTPLPPVVPCTIHRRVGVQGRRVEVVERLRLAEGEPGELDEGRSK